MSWRGVLRRLLEKWRRPAPAPDDPAEREGIRIDYLSVEERAWEAASGRRRDQRAAAQRERDLAAGREPGT